MNATARAIRHVIWMWHLCDWKEQLGDVRERRKRRQAELAGRERDGR